MQLRKPISLWILIMTASVFAGLANADTCDPILPIGPTCFNSTQVVNLHFGTLTLLATDGSTLSTTNLVTASTNIPADFSSSTSNLPTPPEFISSLFPGLVSQMEADPQSTFASLPSWLFTGLTNLEDANGFGDSVDASATVDPAVTDFNLQLANVGGPFATISDTGFQNLPYNPAYCDYLNTLTPGFDLCTGPPPPGENDYTFTYQLGPDVIDGNTFNSDVNFQITERDVTEQLVATPEPSSVLLFASMAFGVALYRRRRFARR